jgi:hypothetical protein
MSDPLYYDVPVSSVEVRGGLPEVGLGIRVETGATGAGLKSGVGTPPSTLESSILTWIDTLSGNVFARATAVAPWVVQGNLKGPAGDTGGSLPWGNVTGKPDTFKAAQTAFPGTGNPWVIAHNQNRFPPVVIVDSAGTHVWGEVVYLNTDVLEVRFGSAFSGTAYLT